MQTTSMDLEQEILAKNASLAQGLRDRFLRSGTYVVNLLSSPGAGKTALLEETLRRVGSEHRVGALVGDQATENDAHRLARSGAPVRQICTGAECRLDAEMIGGALDAFDAFDAGNLEMLAIENVGNLICPAEYDLGEDLRVVVYSVTEGEDKPLKYPLAFTTAHVAVVSKIDLAQAVEFDRDTAIGNIRRVNPNITIFELSARTGEGMEAWTQFVERHLAAKRVPA